MGRTLMAGALMGWNNPPVPWAEFERRLSDGSRPGAPGSSPTAATVRPGAASGMPYRARGRRDRRPPTRVVPYAELHAHSNFSFLDGASAPEELVEEAAGSACTASPSPTTTASTASCAWPRPPRATPSSHTVFGAELSLGLSAPQNGVADPEGSHLLVLARGEEGYHRLAAAITAGQLAGGEKGRPVYDLDELAERAGGAVDAC